MTDVTNTSRVIEDGGVRIDIRPDDLIVTWDAKAWQKRKTTWWGRTLNIILIAVAGVAMLVIVADSNDPFAVLIIFSSFIALGYLMARFAGRIGIHCTRNSIEVIKIVSGRERSRRDYPKAAIGQISYAPVSYSRYGARNGIVFKAEGKKVKTLSGLECPEAQTILRELDRLGFSVFHDVGLPMLVEMALERRNSWMNFR